MRGTQQESPYPKSVETENPLFAAILQALASPILLINAQEQIEWLNLAAQRLFAEEIIKKGGSLPQIQGNDTLIRLLQLTRHLGTEQKIEISLFNGRTFHAICIPIEIDAKLIILHDVTHYSNLDGIKDEIIATAVDDLKPLLSSLLISEDQLTIGRKFDEIGAEAMERIRDTTKQLNEMIGTLLASTHIENGNEVIEETGDLA